MQVRRLHASAKITVRPVNFSQVRTLPAGAPAALRPKSTSLNVVIFFIVVKIVHPALATK